MSAGDVSLSHLAARQHGVVTRIQALGLGLTARQIDLRLAAGALAAVHRSVYRVAAAPRSHEQALLAACLASGGVASHRAAAGLLKLRGIERPPVEISVAKAFRPDLDGVVVHRTSLIGARDTAKCAGIPITKPAMTLLGLGAVAPELLEAATEDAIFRNLVTIDSLWRVVERSGRRGRPGSGGLRALLLARDPGQAPTESPLEDEIVEVLRRFGLPGPVRQYEVARPGRRPLRLDIAYPDVLVDIEGDGLRWHTSTADAQRDRDRANFLVSRGWVLLRFTRDHCRRNPERLARQVREVRASRLHLAAG